MPTSVSGNTPERILDVAQRLVQTRGYHAFSYADVADAIGIRRAAVHYHFPGKDDLGEALAVRYRARFADALARLDTLYPDPFARLQAYGRLYEDTLGDGGRVCLGGMLAADVVTLPTRIAAEVSAFFGDQERWLAGVLAAGRQSGALAFRGTPDEEASLLLATLEGAMLVARAHADGGQDPAAAVPRFATVTRRLIDALRPPSDR